MPFGQNVALVMVNTFVKFEDNAEKGILYKKAIYGKHDLAASGHVF